MRSAAKSSIVVCVLCCVAGWSSGASALEPTNSTTVTKSSFTSLTYSAVIDGQTTYLGVEECKRAAADNISVTARFESSVDLTTQDLTGAKLFQNAYTFGVDRGATASVDCASSGTCVTLSSGALTLNGKTIDATVKFRDLTGIQGAADCETGTLDREYFVRLAFKTSTNSTTIDTEDVRIVLDTIRPEPPASFSALVTEETIQVSWEASPTADVESYGVFYSDQPFEGGVLPSELGGVSRAGNILAPSSGTSKGSLKTSLKAGDTVYIAVSARDGANNDSLVVGADPFEVIATTDFWEDYKARGGEDEGGYCASGGGGGAASGWPVWVMLGLVGARRRRRR
jgi:MYXO-CTERM domain-containing protein